MRLAAQIVSISGGLFGLFSALGVLVFGGSALVGDAGSRGDARLLGLAALVFAVAGIVGGIAISERPQLALPLLLVAAGAGFVPLGWGWFMTAFALGTGVLLTMLSDPTVDRAEGLRQSQVRGRGSIPGRRTHCYARSRASALVVGCSTS